MAHTDYLRQTTGLTLYAKPWPLVASPWATDAIAGSEIGATGVYGFAGLDDDTDYEVFVQAGGTPADTDLAVGILPRLVASQSSVDDVPANVELAIFNEGDATALLAAIAAKVEEFLINEGDATATLTAIAAAVNFAVVSGTVGTQVANLHANQGNWLTATGFATSGALATAQAAIDNVKAVTDQFVFTVIGQVDANAITGGGGTTVNITSSTTVIESQ